jgi:concentrative nucleoside transporter, CNT family
MERAVAVLGILAMIGVAWAASTHRRAISWRPVWVGMLLQLVIAVVALRTDAGAAAFRAITSAAVAVIGAANAGIDFAFGPASIATADGGATALPYAIDLPFSIAVRVLPVIIFMSSVFAVLYHYGVLQWVVRNLARGLHYVMPISAAESLATIANVFVGMTEAPLMVKPYVQGMTRSELFLVMTAGLATVAGSVLFAYAGMIGEQYAGHLIAASFMSAPAAIVYAKLLVPEDGRPETASLAAMPSVERTSVNGIDAAASGAADGLVLALNVGAMLIAFVALIALIDSGLAMLGGWIGLPSLSLDLVLGTLLRPVAWLLGVPWEDAATVGLLLGKKTVINEFLAYQDLVANAESLDVKSFIIASYALCGFANFGSLAILIGGLGGIAPSRRHDIARDGLRAILAGTLATFTTGAIAGVLL